MAAMGTMAAVPSMLGLPSSRSTCPGPSASTPSASNHHRFVSQRARPHASCASTSHPTSSSHRLSSSSSRSFGNTSHAASACFGNRCFPDRLSLPTCCRAASLSAPHAARAQFMGPSDAADSSRTSPSSPNCQPPAALATNSAAEGGAVSPPPAQKPFRLPTVGEWEVWLESRIFDFRFLTFLGVMGSLIGSAISFIKGSLFICESVHEFAHACWQGVGTGRVILLLVEAVDVYLIGTVMLIFGLGLYELFISSAEVAAYPASPVPILNGSSFFGLFKLKARPKWLEITSLDEMKTKLGHVIVMILLVGMFEKSKKVVVTNAMDFFLFSCSVCLGAGCLFLLSKLSKEH